MNMANKKMLLAGAVASFGFAQAASATSLLSQQIVAENGGTNLTGFNLEFNDDDQARFIDETPGGGTVVVPILDAGGVPTGGVVAVDAIEAGDRYEGFADFPTIDISGVGSGIVLDGFELTAIYDLTVTSVLTGLPGPSPVFIEVMGTISFFEDVAENAVFGTDASFSDGTFLGTFDIGAGLFGATSGISALSAASTAAGAIPAGVAVPGSVASLFATFDEAATFGGETGLFADPTLFDGFGLATFSFGLDGPVSGFDFGSSGDVTFPNVSAIPSPTAAAFGLFGLAAVGVRRRKG